MIYALLLPVIILQVFTILRLYKMRRDDAVLFRFCTLQRSIIAYIAENEDKLDQASYAQFRWLIDVNAATVARFNDIKHSFNIRPVLRGLRFVDHEVVEPGRFRSAMQHRQAQIFYAQLISCVILAFLAYTPLIRSEMALRLLQGTADILAKMGVKKVHLWAQEMRDRWAHISGAAKTYGLS